jgi:cell division protein FtsB
MDSKPLSEPLSNRQADNDEVEVLLDILIQKSLEMSRLEVDSVLMVQKLHRVIERLESENEAYRLEMQNLKQEIQDMRYVDLLHLRTVV